MKIAAVYTSASEELLQMVRDALKKELGEDIEIMEYLDPSIIDDTGKIGHLPASGVRRLVNMFEKAVSDGADVIVSCCSSMGDAAMKAQPLYEMMGTKIVRLDEAMADAAVARYSRIGLIATVPTTLGTSERNILNSAAKINKDVDVVIGLANGAFGLDHDAFKKKLIDTAKMITTRVECLVLAQGSMVSVAAEMAEELQMPVFCSIPYAAKEVKEILK